MHELALFAGAGGGILGGLLCGWRTVAAVEIEEYPRAVLLQRQLDGILPRFPVWDDIRTFDGRPWRGKVDIVTGGFPCQDISAAGKGAGLEGERSGLWFEMARVIGEVKPRWVLVENSPQLTGRGLDRVLLDLAKMGYDARWAVLGACDTGAPHERERIWILANSRGGRCDTPEKREMELPGGTEVISTGENDTYCHKIRCDRRAGDFYKKEGRGESTYVPWWAVEPELDRVAHGVANRVDRIKALGNGQVPAVVRLAWEMLR